MINLNFNGYRLDFVSVGQFSAKLVGGHKLPEGLYEVGNVLRNPPQLLQKRFQIKSKPPLLALTSSYELHGINEISIPGIKVDPLFFHRLANLSPVIPQTNLLLEIKYAAPWMLIAQNELGQHEVAGKKANPRILEYFKSSKFWGTDDSGGKNAWCASFVSWVFTQYGLSPPKAAFRAKSWADFGTEVKVPTYGALGIKSRRGGGHVAFVVGKSSDGNQLYMLGGNQNDEVNISRYSKNVWEKFVIPNGYDNSKDTLPIYTSASKVAGSES